MSFTAVHGEKPEKVNGIEFNRWQKKMFFYLTTLNLVRFLKENAPIVAENEIGKENMAAFEAWGHDDFLCRNYVLNGPDNSLYNVYSPMTTVKLLWESLEKKHKTEGSGLKKFIVGKFPDYRMVDSKYVMSQVQEMQLILHDLHAEGMEMNESVTTMLFLT
ncbi:hypothetical protein F511_22096 [Dorcoceras hygrometricum]|uniref:Uncharacterized protein n=1 Tax=Dorcoceras hygrometricum TaxID=472368 RepID=A0A2Z7BV39_9LAMI|nr:hypothetical protein F511_22096 [Dorcoceras hygrometricum]